MLFLPGADTDHHLRGKESIRTRRQHKFCVVCGSHQNCVRKNIVPHEYRRQNYITTLLLHDKHANRIII